MSYQKFKNGSKEETTAEETTAEETIKKKEVSRVRNNAPRLITIPKIVDDASATSITLKPNQAVPIDSYGVKALKSNPSTKVWLAAKLLVLE